MDRVRNVLTSLGVECQEEGPSAHRVTTPYWRSDIAIEDDLVEEVARIIGYEAIPTTMLSTPIPANEPQTLRNFRAEVRALVGMEGVQGATSY